MRFLDFDLDPARRELRKRGAPVEIQPLVYELLLYLVSHRDRVVPKDELLDVLWAGSAVTDASLARAVSLARRALDDDDRRAPIIRTHPRVGYRFTAAVEQASVRASGAPASTHRDLPMRSGYADAGGTHIAYQVLGDGPRDLVVVHGWILSMASMWEDDVIADFHRRLAEHARLILFDKRGTGLSDRVKTLPGLAQRMEDLTAVLDAVGSPQARVLGISEGAPMSLLYAASHPERVTGLALLGGFARMMRDADQPFGWTAEDVERLCSYIRTRWGEGATLSASFASRSDQPEVAAWLARAEQMGGSPGAAMELWNMNRSIDVRDVLPVLRTQSLVLHASRDRVIDVAHGRQLAEQIEGARYVEIDAIDHMPIAPPHVERVLEEIVAWLERPSAPPLARRRLATLLICRSDSEREGGVLESIDQLLLAHGGRRVDAGGAECAAVFDGPVAAAHCAGAIVAALRRQGARARLAFHCGELEYHDSGAPGDARGATATGPRALARVQGPAVEVAAGLLELAEPGEVLTTGTVTELAVGSSLEFDPRPGAGRAGGAGARSVYALR